MFPISAEEALRAALASRESEVQRLFVEKAAGRVHGNERPTMWRWRVEPGKEEAFEHLRSWLLINLNDGPVETATPDPAIHARPPERTQESPAERRAAGRRSSPVRGGARLAGRSLLRAGRRLLEWGGEPSVTEESRV
jgi:hypothetical protein